MDENKALKTIIALWSTGLLISLGATGLIIYIVFHFIAKFW